MVNYVRVAPQPTVDISKATTGGAVADLPNWGTSIITATSAEKWCLAPPEAGVEKTIIINSYSTTALPVVYLCTNAAATISILGASTNYKSINASAARSTAVATVVKLIGVSSVQWAMVSSHPPVVVTTGSTGVGGTVTLTSS